MLVARLGNEVTIPFTLDFLFLRQIEDGRDRLLPLEGDDLRASVLLKMWTSLRRRRRRRRGQVFQRTALGREWTDADARREWMDFLSATRDASVIIRVKSYVAFTSASAPCHPFVFCVSPLKIDYPVSVKNGPSRCPSFLSCRSGGSPVTDSNIPPLTS